MHQKLLGIEHSMELEMAVFTKFLTFIPVIRTFILKGFSFIILLFKI